MRCCLLGYGLLRSRFFRVVFYLVLVMGLSACTHKLYDANPYLNMSAKALFTHADHSLVKGAHSQSIKYLEALDTAHPFSKYAEQAQLNLIYAYYKNGDNALATATADRYIHLYPRSPHVEYAYYMKGVANFYQTRGVFAELFSMDLAWRDPGTQTNAYDDFTTFLRRFPKSIYAADARQRLIYLRNLFAQKILYIAQYYMRHKMYVAAVNRASFLVSHYPQAPQAKEALVILVKANRALGLRRASKDAKEVLHYNYPYMKP